MDIGNSPAFNATPFVQGPWQHPGMHILDVLTDAALVLDQDEHILHINPAAQRLLQLTTNAKGQAAKQVMALLQGENHQPVQLALRRTPTPNFSGDFDLLVRNDGSSIPVEISVSPLAQQAPGHLLLQIRDASRVQNYINQLAYSSSHDEQTRLLRRSELIRRLTYLLQNKTCRENHAFLLVDINNFKSLNDQAGHAAGDAAIRQVATRLQSVIRGRDTLARMGGDEFGILLEHCPESHAHICVKMLQDTVASQPLMWQGESIPLSISIGLTCLGDSRYSVYSVLKAADMACHRAKRQHNMAAS